MTINNITISQLLTIALLMSHSPVYNMDAHILTRDTDKCLILEIPWSVILPTAHPTLYATFCDTTVSCINYLKKPIQKYKAYNAQHYNQDNILITLPYEILEPVVSQINPLEDGIKSALALRTTCKHFYTLPLEHFGKAYQHHNKTEKNAILKNVLLNMNDKNYWNRRCGALMLIHAGADNNADEGYPLLQKAILKNDTDMITTLLENGTNPSQKSYGAPNFFYIKTIDIAKIFTAYGVNWNTEGSYPECNVLWANILHNPSSKLIQFYLNHHVNTKKIDSDGNCLLHFLVRHPAYSMRDIDDYVKIGTLLIKAAPELVNTLNNKDETPIDTARNRIKNNFGGGFNDRLCKANERLIELFEEQIFINKIKQYSHCIDPSKE
jgi:hypothetical protein